MVGFNLLVFWGLLKIGLVDWLIRFVTPFADIFWGWPALSIVVCMAVCYFFDDERSWKTILDIVEWAIKTLVGLLIIAIGLMIFTDRGFVETWSYGWGLAYGIFLAKLGVTTALVTIVHFMGKKNNK